MYLNLTLSVLLIIHGFILKFHIYDWASINNMIFNAQKFHYITFSSKESSCLSNVYINPKLNIINPSSEVLDLGVYM